MGSDCSRPCHETVTEFYLPSGLGGRGPFPYRANDWSVRDFDRFGEILSEHYNRERGRRGRLASPLGLGMQGGMGYGMGALAPGVCPLFNYSGSMGGMPGGMGRMPYLPGYMPWMMMPPDEYSASSGAGGRRQGPQRYPTMSDFERMQEQIDERFRRIAEEYQRNMTERDSFLFGSEAERRQEQYKQRMLKTLQEMMPQLSQLFTMGQMPGVGAGPGMPGGMPMMGPQPGMPGMGPGGGFGAGVLGGFPGMGVNPPMMGGADPRMMGMGDRGGGRGLGRRRRRGRSLGFSGGFDDDDDDFGSGFGRDRRRRRRGGFGGDDDDDFGFGHGPRPSPRGPTPRPRPRPRPDDGDDGPFGGGGSTGATFGSSLFADARPTVSSPDEPLFSSTRHSPRMQRPTPMPARPTDRPSSAQDPLRPRIVRSPPPTPPGMRARPSTFTADDQLRPQTPGGLIPVDTPSSSYPAALYGAFAPPPFPPDGPSMPPSSPLSGPAGILRPDGGSRRPGMEGRNVSFQGERPKLSRTREDEERRGEAEAGGTAGPGDIK